VTTLHATKRKRQITPQESAKCPEEEEEEDDALQEYLDSLIEKA
jgi:hypothetical protein